MWIMDVVENALLELQNWDSLQTPDNLAAFILARHILGIVPVNSTVDIRAFAKEFYKQSEGVIDGCGEEIVFDDFITQLENAMDKVKYPVGREMEFLLERVAKVSIPDDLATIEDGDAQLIARVCRLLQQDAGNKPFHLSQTNAGKLIGKQRAAGGRKLATLERKGFIQLERKGFPGVSSYYKCSTNRVLISL